VVVGLGPAGPELLALEALHQLTNADRAYLRTARHPAAADLEGIESFDRLYDRAATFDDVYEGIVTELVAAARDVPDGGRVVYAVPGSPLVAERTVELLREQPGVEVTVLPALSFLDLAWSRLAVDPLSRSVRLIDGSRFAEQAAGQRGPLLVAQCWSSSVLSEIKLSVDTDAEPTPPPVTMLYHLGLGDERVELVPWHDLDRRTDADHLTSLWIPELPAPPGSELVALGDLVRTLRSRCPWDKEQTHQSLSRHLLEESYEVIDAIEGLGERPADAGAPGDATEVSVSGEELAAADHLEEELGDLLFQIYFHAALATEEGLFTLADVARGIREKLVARHPHVFGDAVADDAAAVVAGWERAKMTEKGRQSVTDGIPATLPALALASALQRKALMVDGVDHPNFATTRDDLREAIGALRDPVVDTGSETPAPPADPGLRDEVGRLLFSLSDIGRRLGVDPEEALRSAARRFEAEVRRAELR